MVCEDLSVMGNNIGLVEILIYPTTCFYYTYAFIFFALFILLSLFLYNREKGDGLLKPDMISSLGTSASAILFLALIGTLIKTTDNIPLVQFDIFRYIFVIWMVLAAVWYWKRD